MPVPLPYEIKHRSTVQPEVTKTSSVPLPESRQSAMSQPNPADTALPVLLLTTQLLSRTPDDSLIPSPVLSSAVQLLTTPPEVQLIPSPVFHIARQRSVVALFPLTFIPCVQNSTETSVMEVACPYTSITA